MIQLIIGGERLNVDTDLNGNAFVNRDSSENVKRGRDSKYASTGYVEHAFGAAGAAAMFGLGGVGLAEGLARNAGMKNGIVKPIGKASLNKAAEILGFEKPFSSKPNEAGNETKNSNSSKTTDSPESKSKNSVHNDSFEGKKYNEGGGKTQAFKAYEESVAKNPQRGKFLKALFLLRFT
jgi:hypothetical protein